MNQEIYKILKIIKENKNNKEDLIYLFTYNNIIDNYPLFYIQNLFINNNNKDKNEEIVYYKLLFMFKKHLKNINNTKTLNKLDKIIKEKLIKLYYFNSNFIIIYKDIYEEYIINKNSLTNLMIKITNFLLKDILNYYKDEPDFLKKLLVFVKNDLDDLQLNIEHKEIYYQKINELILDNKNKPPYTRYYKEINETQQYFIFLDVFDIKKINLNENNNDYIINLLNNKPQQNFYNILNTLKLLKNTKLIIKNDFLYKKLVKISLIRFNTLSNKDTAKYLQEINSNLSIQACYEYIIYYKHKDKKDSPIIPVISYDLIDFKLLKNKNKDFIKKYVIIMYYLHFKNYGGYQIDIKGLLHFIKNNLFLNELILLKLNYSEEKDLIINKLIKKQILKISNKKIDFDNLNYYLEIDNKLKKFLKEESKILCQ